MLFIHLFVFVFIIGIFWRLFINLFMQSTHDLYMLFTYSFIYFFICIHSSIFLFAYVFSLRIVGIAFPVRSIDEVIRPSLSLSFSLSIYLSPSSSVLPSPSLSLPLPKYQHLIPWITFLYTPLLTHGFISYTHTPIHNNDSNFPNTFSPPGETNPTLSLTLFPPSRNL